MASPASTFYVEKGEQKYLMEVKGCTLEVDGIGYFPGCTHRAGREAPARTGAGTTEGISVRCGLCDSDGRHHRGAAKCQHTAGVWHGTGRSKGRRWRVLFLLCRVGRDSLEIVEQREGVKKISENLLTLTQRHAYTWLSQGEDTR